MIPTILYVFQLMIESLADPKDVTKAENAQDAFKKDLDHEDKKRVEKAVADYQADPTRLGDISRELLT